MYCPKDGKACMNDLCHGAGCLVMDGYAMLAVCDFCGGMIDEEIPDCGTCTCDGDEPGWCDDCGKRWEDCRCSLDYPKASSNASLTRGEAVALKR